METFSKNHYMQWGSGQGLWAHIPENDWNSWKWQLRNRLVSIEQLKSFMTLTKSEETGCSLSSKRLSLAITPYFFNLIDRDNPECPIRKQVIPRAEEGIVSPEEFKDPIGEESHMPVEGLVHKYPDRVLFLVTSCCASYCRYCTRSRLVSGAQGYDFSPSLEKGLDYVRCHTEIRDVLLSGGDPLLLADSKIDYLLTQLRNIPHVEFIRIGSRIPIFMPQRITQQLCNVLRKHRPIWMSLHCNHFKECTKELKQACESLLSSCVVLGNQSVLLKGVNDSAETLLSLNHRLLQLGIRPYYLHQCDLITGSSHFRTDVSKGIEIIQKLQGHTTGYAVPQYVIDTPGGGGKVPIHPNYVASAPDGNLVLTNYQGEVCIYPGKNHEQINAS